MIRVNASQASLREKENKYEEMNDYIQLWDDLERLTEEMTRRILKATNKEVDLDRTSNSANVIIKEDDKLTKKETEMLVRLLVKELRENDFKVVVTNTEHAEKQYKVTAIWEVEAGAGYLGNGYEYK